MPLTTRGRADGSVDLLEQIVRVFATYVDTEPHYLVGLALWALHTHNYKWYPKSPRLSILSPVHNCGKSTVLDILGAMAWQSKRLIDPTVAATFRLANKHTLLIDEVDNMSIIKNMRSILNDGHSEGGSVTRTGKDGNVISYPVYGPVALAGIGRLPATLMSRSLIIRLHRSTKAMERFVPREQHYAPALYAWAEQAILNPKPILLAQLVGREADKWRPLIAIADYFDRGEIAREVALKFLEESGALDIKESVLRDTERVFTRANTGILTADTLYEKLREDEEGDFEADYEEHKITKRMIGNILADFQIRTKPYRYKGGTPQRCWFKEDFEEMWERYA
jgi:Protein of unknown function (DUF3631)